MTSRQDYMSLGGSREEADALGLVSRAEMGDDNYLIDCERCCGDGEHDDAPCPDCDGSGRVVA